jgi:hypothetical protein
MAITIISYDATIGHLADNIIVALSTNTSQPGFKYIVDVSITGQTFWGQNYLRFFVPPEPGTLILRFNISDVIRDICDVDMIDENNTSFCYKNPLRAGYTVTVNIGEAYFTTPTTYSLFPSLNVLQQKMFLFSYFNSKDYGFLQPMYDITSNLFIDRRKIKKWFLLPFNYAWWYQPYSQDDLTLNQFEYKVQTSVLNFIDNSNAIKPMIITPLTQPHLAVCAIGTLATSFDTFYDFLNNSGSNTFQLRSVTPMPDFVYTFNIERPCRIDGAIIYWVNQYGQLEHYYFPVFKKRINTTTTDYIVRKDKDRMRFQDRYYSREDESIIFTTGTIVDDTEAEALRDILTSRYVWYNTESDASLKRILVTDSSMEVKRYRTDKAFQLTITAKTRQRIAI